MRYNDYYVREFCCDAPFDSDTFNAYIEELRGKMFDIGKGKQVSQYMYSVTDVVYRVLLHIINKC